MFAVLFWSSCNSVLPADWRINKDWKGILAIFICFIKTLFKICYSIFTFSLLFRVVFTFLFFSTPFQAQAGFFSSILGDEAYADTEVVLRAQSEKNSQTMDLLQANVSPSSSTDTNNTPLHIDSEVALSSTIGPMGVSDGKDLDASTLETSVYVVRQGDSISAIAQMFDVSINTILWANDMKKDDKLVPDDVLFILPISGLEHTVAKGQTLQSIAKLYKVDVTDIVQNNDITEDTKLAVGDTLMIPDAVKAEEGDKPVKDLGASIAKDKQYYEKHPVKNLAGYYVNPVPGYRKSQGIHDKNAIDFAIAKGTPIHAAAAGKVTLARTGYNGGFGNLVIISHPNGTETLYAHQSKIATKTGAKVSQGEVIGYVGSTGRSTGPHLHFEVHGARNPGTDGSWAN